MKTALKIVMACDVIAFIVAIIVVYHYWMTVYMIIPLLIAIYFNLDFASNYISLKNMKQNTKPWN